MSNEPSISTFEVNRALLPLMEKTGSLVLAFATLKAEARTSKVAVAPVPSNRIRPVVFPLTSNETPHSCLMLVMSPYAVTMLLAFVVIDAVLLPTVEVRVLIWLVWDEMVPSAEVTRVLRPEIAVALAEMPPCADVKPV